MSIRTWLLPALLLSASVFAQTAADKSSRSSSAKPNMDRAAVEKIARDFEAAAAKKDAAAIAQMYHSQAHMLGGNAPEAVGRDAIQKAWQGAFDAQLADIKLQTDTVERHGDILVELGHYTATFGGKPDKGKYVVLYKKEGGGWKLWVDSYSSDAPPAM